MHVQVFFVGRSGVGKSETALQLLKLYERSNREHTSCLTRSFNTDSVGALINDLTNFNQDKDLQMQKLGQLQRQENLGPIFKELFETLNRKFPNDVKFLIFDDAEKSTSIVKHINNEICGRVVGDDIHKKWKIIITTQDDQQREWLSGCDYVRRNNFVKVDVFDEPQTRYYLTEVEGLTQEHHRLLHEKLGGLPLALKVAREYLLSNPVS